MSIFSHSSLTRLSWLLGLLLLGAACEGTEGTLVVRHEAAAGAAGTATVAEKPYVPANGVRWFAKLDGAVDLQQPAALFYLDADLQAPEDLVTLHEQGRHYFCYLSAGSLETFRDDAGDFPGEAVGNPLANFPEERWLDVRDAQVRELMAKRVTALAAQGCDGVAPSSLSVHAADTGFALTPNDALDYARWLAERIHAAGMSAALSGPAELTSELWPTFDFGLAIGCMIRSECAEYGPLEQAQKPVLHLELGDEQAAPELCNTAKTLGFDALISDPDFTGRCITCSDIW